MLLITICKGFCAALGAGFEFLLHAIKKQKTVKIKNTGFLMVVRFSFSYVTTFNLVSSGKKFYTLL